MMSHLSAILDDVRASLSEGDRIGALERLADVVRDGPFDDTEARLIGLVQILEGDRDFGLSIGRAIGGLLAELRVGPALLESGITSTMGFTAELTARLVGRFLPDLVESDDLRAVVRRITKSRDDHRRLASVPDGVFIRLFAAFGFGEGTAPPMDPEVATAAQTLAHYAASLGLQPEFTRRLPHLAGPDSPFLELGHRVRDYIDSTTREDGDVESVPLTEVMSAIAQCRAEVEHLRASKAQHGTSLRLTGMTFRLLQLLDRLATLLEFTDRPSGRFEPSAVRLLKEIVEAEQKRHHVLPLLRARADLLAFQVVEHAARKGGKYITSGRRDYGGFFLASLGGGAIVALFSFFKVLLGGLDAPLGVEALLYGLNYSFCFVLIYLTGSALATKQPAMTANTVARALGNRMDRHMDQLETLVVRVWRSQFVSFVGNLSMALPMAFLISEVFLRSNGTTVASSEKALSMLEALHPWRSGSIIFAAIAGIFLFLAGLISAWVDNRMVYSHVTERVAKHPLLIRVTGARRATSIASLLERKLGIIAGNVFLGFALGSTGTVGEILGLPLDIRHVAFASAEFGTALEVLNFRLAIQSMWPIALGIVFIGLVNFLVSFGLSLATALESRNITWHELRTLVAHLAGSFMRRPLDWFFPPREAALE
jgi:site-specific recombinase